MAFLLDTHAFLWFVSGDRKLPGSVRDKIKDINYPCFLSAGSLWEITIKHQIGKLVLDISLQELFEYVERNQIEVIPISYDHLLTLSTLPNHHSDSLRQTHNFSGYCRGSYPDHTRQRIEKI